MAPMSSHSPIYCGANLSCNKICKNNTSDSSSCAVFCFSWDFFNGAMVFGLGRFFGCCWVFVIVFAGFHQSFTIL